MGSEVWGGGWGVRVRVGERGWGLGSSEMWGGVGSEFTSSGVYVRGSKLPPTGVNVMDSQSPLVLSPCH